MKKLLEEFDYRGIHVQVYSRETNTLTPKTDSPIVYYTTSNIDDWTTYRKTPEEAVEGAKVFIDRFLDREINTIEDLARAIEKHMHPHGDLHLDINTNALRILINKYMDSTSPKDSGPVPSQEGVSSEVGCGTALKRYMDEKGLTIKYLKIDCYYPEDDEEEIYFLVTDEKARSDYWEPQLLDLDTYIEVLDRDTKLITYGYAQFTNGESVHLTFDRTPEWEPTDK